MLAASAIGAALNVADWFGRADGLVGWAIDLLAGLGPVGAIVPTRRGHHPGRVGSGRE